MPNLQKSIDRMMVQYKKNLDKIQAAPPNEQLVMERTFSTACMILDELDGVSISELAIGICQFCHGTLSGDLPQKYNSQLGFAFTSPGEFVTGLHNFYLSLSSEIRRKKKFPQIADFLGTTLRLQSEKRNLVSDNIINAYLDLSMQTMEYLRPDKDALDTYIQGVSTKGEPLAGPCPYPFSDVPTIQLRRRSAINGEQMGLGWDPEEIRHLYTKYGIFIKSPQDFARLEQVQRGHCNMAAALLPFINERTRGIAPAKMYDSHYAPLTSLTYSLFDLEGMQKRLISDRQFLPDEGVRIRFEDPAREIRELFLMETQHKNKPYVLYKITFSAGDLSGYYDIHDAFLYSILQEGSSQLPYRNLTALLIAVYSSLVLPKVTLPPLDFLFRQAGRPLQVRLSEVA